MTYFLDGPYLALFIHRIKYSDDDELSINLLDIDYCAHGSSPVEFIPDGICAFKYVTTIIVHTIYSNIDDGQNSKGSDHSFTSFRFYSHVLLYPVRPILICIKVFFRTS